MGFWGLGGLTNWPSDDIMLAKTATTPYISDTFSDTIGDTLYYSDTLGGISYKDNNFYLLLYHIQYILNNLLPLSFTNTNSFSLYITQTYIFYYI
jgi:hypothetical protein